MDGVAVWPPGRRWWRPAAIAMAPGTHRFFRDDPHQLQKLWTHDDSVWVDPTTPPPSKTTTGASSPRPSTTPRSRRPTGTCPTKRQVPARWSARSRKAVTVAHRPTRPGAYPLLPPTAAASPTSTRSSVVDCPSTSQVPRLVSQENDDAVVPESALTRAPLTGRPRASTTRTRARRAPVVDLAPRREHHAKAARLRAQMGAGQPPRAHHRRGRAHAGPCSVSGSGAAPACRTAYIAPRPPAPAIRPCRDHRGGLSRPFHQHGAGDSDR